MQSVIINNSSDSYKNVIEVLKKKINQGRLIEFINQKDKLGNTALLYAAYRGNIFIVRSLIECGADINVVSTKKLNVLHMAAQGNNPNVIIYFKEKYHMSFLTQDSQGNVPLHWACYNSSEEAINFLLKDMDDINIKNNDGRTPLHVAVFTEKPSLIKKLLKKGADITIKDKEGKTPILLAFELTGPNSRIMNVLLSSKPSKSLLHNIFRISSSENRSKQDENQTLATPSMYLIISIIFWILVFFFQLNYLPYFYTILFFIFIFILLISFIYMNFSNAGIVEDANYKNIDWLQLVINDINIKNMCPYCKVKKQRLSRHCFYCKKCIKEQNYHCNLINNCIGENNSCGYIFFLVMHIVLFFYMGFASFKVLIMPAINPLLNQNQFIIQFNLLNNQTVKTVGAFFVITTCIIGLCTSFIITFKHIRQTIINSKIKELNDE